MCENIICYLKLHSFLLTIFSLLLILGFYLFLHLKKKGEIHREWNLRKKLLNFLEEKVFILFFIILIILVLAAFNSVILNTKDLIPRDKIAESYALIFSAIITVFGVFAGFYFNKKQTYKEIVTRERIEWLHKMQEALAEFLALTSENKPVDKVKEAGELYNLIISNLNVKEDKDKEEARKLYYLIISNLNVKEDKDKARAKKLYYLIISNLNVKEDKKKKKKKENKNERDAVELLYKYAISKGLDVELNFVKDEDSDEDKDSNDTKSIDKSEKEKLKAQKENPEKKEEDHLAGLKRKEIIKQYTKIFNKTWNRIKNEAD